MVYGKCIYKTFYNLINIQIWGENMDELEYLEEMDLIGDESIYSQEGREQLIDDGELSPTEAAFMQGYEEAYD